jgi:hypothetical protein
VGKQG